MKKTYKFLLFILSYALVFLPLDFCSAKNVLKIPQQPGAGTSLPVYLKWVFDFGLAIGFMAVMATLAVSGVFFILGGIPSMRSKARELLSSAIAGFLILSLLYLILVTLNPNLAFFKDIQPVKTEGTICQDPITNPDGTVTCQGKIHGVYFYTGGGCQGDSFGSGTNVPDISAVSKKIINSVGIIQDRDHDIYHIAITYGTPNYYGQCQYIYPNKNCNSNKLTYKDPNDPNATAVPLSPKSASIYTYNFNASGSVTFYRNGAGGSDGFYKDGGFLTLDDFQIGDFYEEDLKNLKFNGNADPSSDKLDDCTVPKDQQDCVKWDKTGKCTEKKCPTLSGHNIGSIKISGDSGSSFLVVLVYNGPGDSDDVSSFCQAYPKDSDINPYGPKQVKWDKINSTTADRTIFPNHVWIIPIEGK